MKTSLILLLLIFLHGCATSRPPLSALLKGELQSLSATTPTACTYEKSITENGVVASSAWHFWRWTNRTESKDELSRQGEIWQKNATGQIFYTRIFYPERVALEYMPGDMLAIGVQPNWKKIEAGLIDPAQLGRELRLVNRQQNSGLALEHYAGKTNGSDIQVDWLPSLGLPIRVEKQFQGQVVSLSMKECSDLAKGKTMPIATRELDGYRHIDFSDLGDMESDPVVQKIIATIGGHTHHH